jgi:hypothetical protein
MNNIHLPPKGMKPERLEENTLRTSEQVDEPVQQILVPTNQLQPIQKIQK